MFRRHSPATLLADRLCRPQRIGVFGHRGVGKTTLLTMLYREGVHGRLPDIRLAAADARTADYLSGKIVQLESGQPLPATLAETDLRFHLYHKQTRIELLVKDYQGEHVELTREGPLQEFLRDCDAVWLCLDPTDETSSPFTRQQEIERLIEDYLGAEATRHIRRPIALVVTKADRLDKKIRALPPFASQELVDALAQDRFGMTLHAILKHCPHNGVIAVSSLASVAVRPVLEPWNLAEPLAWLAETLQARDEARLAELFASTTEVALLNRCVRCFAHRYPEAPALTQFRKQLSERKWRQRRRRGLAGAAAAACLLAGLWTYEALGYQSAERFAERNAGEPAVVLAHWHSYQAWHPARHVLGIASEDTEQDRLRELSGQVRERERTIRQAELRQLAADPDGDPEVVWARFQEFRRAFPEVGIEGELGQFRQAVKARKEQQLVQRAHRAFDELQRSAQRPGDLAALAVQADRYLRDFPDSVYEPEVRKLRQGLLARLDEQDIELARSYSAKNPLNFQTRKELYQRYLDKHPQGGAYAAEAKAALPAIEADWDRHDFRAVRDFYQARPGDVAELVSLCRRYLTVHSRGQFRPAALELLRWTEKVTGHGEYKVVLRSGHVDKSVARFFSRGPKLSVEIEVNGVRHGPSTIIYNQYDPQWDYEYPRPIKWKMGDQVVIRVTEHSWKDRIIMEVSSTDPLGMKLLTGEVASGPNRIAFESTFAVPRLPKVE